MRTKEWIAAFGKAVKMGCTFQVAADAADLDQFNRELDRRPKMSHEFTKLSKEQKELMFEGIAMMQVLYDVAGEGPISHNNFMPHATKNGDVARYDVLTGWLERAGFLTAGQLTVQLTQRGLDVVRATKA